MLRAGIGDHGCHGVDNSVELVITATGSSRREYGRLWRRTVTFISVGIFISVKRTPSSPHEENSLLSPAPTSSPLITSTEDSSSSQRETLNAKVRNIVSKSCNSFSSKSFSEQEASSPSISLVGQGLSRQSSSAQSHHVIDIRGEEETNERERVRQIVNDRDLSALKKFGGVEKVAAVFGSDLENGVQGIENQQVGNEVIRPVNANGFFFFLIKASKSYTILLLFVSAGLSFTTEAMEQGLEDAWHDGVAILAAVFMLVMFQSIANYRRARNLSKKENDLEVEVVRGRVSQSVSISNLVEGDIVSLKEGDLVPGDGLLVNGDELALDDNLNPKIDVDKNPFLFFHSKVRRGTCSMLVVSVGEKNTILDKGLSLVKQNPNKKKLIEAQLEKPNTYIENLSLVVSILIASVTLIRLLCKKHDGVDSGIPELKSNVTVYRFTKILEKLLLKPQGRVSVVVSTITVVVVAIQHGMPFVITISLSCWNEKVLKRNQAKPQNLSACPTMGNVTVICIDASGGLLCDDDMEVNRFWVGVEDVADNDASDSEISPVIVEALERAFGASLFVAETCFSPACDILVSWAESRWSLNMDLVDQHLSTLDYTKLSINRKVYGVLMENKGDEESVLRTHWNGAASTILHMCSHYYDSDGEIHAIGDEEEHKFREVIKDMEGSGLRPIAFACKQTELKRIEEDGLCLLALTGLKYSCSEEIKSSIEALRYSEVRIMLISEDELSTVQAIACELDFCRSELNDYSLEIEEFRDMNIDERMEKMDQMSIMGSCLADDKLLVVQHLQEKGHVVAFFGGSSISDVPALVQADVGITRDSKCNEICKEHSDIVIPTKDLPLILKFGRCIYCNIQIFSQLQLTVCISGLLINFITTSSLDETPLTTVQLICVNCISCLLGSLMMVMELPSQKLVSYLPPANRTQLLVTKAIWVNVITRALSQVSVFLIFQFKGKVMIPTMEKHIQKAMIFSSFILCQIFNQLNAMELICKENLLVVLKDYYFLVALGSVTTMEFLVVEFAKSLADCSKLNGTQWAICFVLAALPLGIHSVLGFLLTSLLGCYKSYGFWSREGDIGC